MMVGGKQARDTWLIHLVVWQKSTQHCKAITLQLETLKKKNNNARMPRVAM